jgi:hypothetical protein
MKRKTAVEWLKSELPLDWDDPYYRDIIKKALQMEQSQSTDAWWDGFRTLPEIKTT